MLTNKTNKPFEICFPYVNQPLKTSTSVPPVGEQIGRPGQVISILDTNASISGITFIDLDLRGEKHGGTVGKWRENMRKEWDTSEKTMEI